MSIAKKLTLIVAMLAGLLLAGTGYGLMLFREQELIDQVRLQAKLLSRVVQLSAETALENYGHLGALEDLVSRSMAASIIFYGPDARAVAPVPPEEQPVVNARARRVMERNRPEEELVESGYAYRVPLRHRGKVEGAMELRIDLRRVMPEGYLDKALLAAGGLFLVFALLLGLFLRQSIGKPIYQLMDGMDQVIRGDLTAALPLDRADEIGRIAYRFNEMTAQLRDAQEEIRNNAQAKIKLEQRLRQSEKLATIGQLAAEIAHEVGTPLNVIGGRARTIDRKADVPETVRKNAQIIADQAGRITKIIQQMLDLSRRRNPDRVAVDLPGCVAAALELLEYQMEQAKIRVRNTIPRDLPQVHGDPDGLQQVFINLVLNAVQAMSSGDQGGTLSLSAEVAMRRKEGLEVAPPQRFVSVEISDTGAGIPEDLRGQIFEPFYSTKDKGEGTGLGLTVVHGIVKEHDGWIDVRHPEEGGTLFRVHLPADEPSRSEEGDKPDDEEMTAEEENSDDGRA
jgi:signal transduction histidine kinase